MFNPESVYLFLGPEIGQKTDEIHKIQKTYQEQTGENSEIHKFYPYDTSIGEVISLMKNGALFSSYKFVTFMNISAAIITRVTRYICLALAVALPPSVRAMDLLMRAA